jgi:hypothetical protein
MGNYRELKVEHTLTQDEDYSRNIKQKMTINLLNVCFLLLFETHIVFSMILFQVMNEVSSEQKISVICDNSLEYWYKFSNIVMI